jgi:RimJ/RimL family protein N-acetyltransferase
MAGALGIRWTRPVVASLAGYRPSRRVRVKLLSVLIETERLDLRPMTIADLDEFVALPFAAPPFDHQRAIARLHANEAEWKHRGQGILAILDHVSGRVVGRVALKYWAQRDETWFGIALHRDDWGHGFATEAGRACVAWGFRDLGIPYIWAMIDPENTRAIELVERLGMTRQRALGSFDDSAVLYRVTREDWERGGGTEG